jgi:sigma-B regulation protein RsbU (phosphoserine phosphatase)
MKAAHILVVDDDAGMLRAIERVLTPRYDLTCTAAPHEALALARERRADLALIDIRMPQLSGLALMEQLRAADPQLDVILMTGSVHEVDAHMARAIRGGAYYFLQKPFDRDVLLTLVDRCLTARRLEQDNRRHVERLTRERDLARRFQQSMLPRPHLIAGRIELHALYAPCDALGGDFYDYAPLSDRALGLILADVSGHGVSAAMLTGIVKSAFHGCAADAFDPRIVTQRIAADFRIFGFSRFASAFCARVHLGSGRLEYVNAGHPPAYLRSGDGAIRELASTGPIICGGLPDMSFERRVLTLRSGDRLLAYTDGLPECDGAGGAFGYDRVRRLAQQDLLDTETLLGQSLAAADAHRAGRPAADDITLLAITWSAAGSRARSPRSHRARNRGVHG